MTTLRNELRRFSNLQYSDDVNTVIEDVISDLEIQEDGDDLISLLSSILSDAMDRRNL